MRGMVVGEGGRSSGVLLYYKQYITIMHGKYGVLFRSARFLMAVHDKSGTRRKNGFLLLSGYFRLNGLMPSSLAMELTCHNILLKLQILLNRPY